jgi:hypothetical protein
MKKKKIKREKLDEPSAELGLGVQVGGESYGSRLSAAKVCTFCKHSYLKPCTDKTKSKCRNWQHIQEK